MIRFRFTLSCLLFGLLCFLQSCQQNTQKPTDQSTTSLPIPDQRINKSDLVFQRQGGIWTLTGQSYSGYVQDYYANGKLKELFAVVDGLKQGKATTWFPDGHQKVVEHYHRGKIHGEKKIWSPNENHQLVAHFNYYLGKTHGVQKKWYPTGEVFKIMNINMGREEGLQQAFRKNGDLFANYEAKNGRIFGLKRSNLCYEVDNEIVQY